MKIFAIGDLHLPGGDDKPMNVFGAHWDGHFEKIGRDWSARVGQEDIVLIPGDISWAMQLADALPDLEAIHALPGRKVLLRGNHDYWWPGIMRLRDALPKGMYAVQNDALSLDGVTLSGSRGWLLPNVQTTAEDKKVYERELIRLRLSLERAQRLGGRQISMMHYPPVPEDGSDTAFSRLFEEFAVRDVVYGHLHGAANRSAFCGEKNGTRYHCVSCDRLGFALYCLPEA